MTIQKNQLTVFRCAFCQSPMIDGRKDKVTCSDRCRKRYSRWRSRIMKLEARIERDIFEIEQYFQFHDAADKAALALCRIEDKVLAAKTANRVQAVK